MRRRAETALLALALLCSCKRDASPPAAPSPAATATPAGEVRLSYFEPSVSGCAWIRHEAATGARTTLATVPGACAGARVAWSADRTRALLWTEIGEPPISSLHELGPGGLAARPAPSVGALRDAGFDASGRLLALTLEEIPSAQARGSATERGKTVMADGEKLTVPSEMDGLPAVARAFVWESGAWKRIETKMSDDAWDLALGIAALDAEKTLGARSWKMLTHMPDGREVKPDEARALDAGCPRTSPDAGSWFQPLGASVFVRLEESEFVIAVPPVCALDASRKTAAALALDLDAEDSIALQLSSGWMLVSDSGGRRPHLVDPAHKIVWSSKTAVEAVFWP